ncbi:MAG: hypothetical protein AAGF77_06905 [Bacteroidota bacterium]
MDTLRLMAAQEMAIWIFGIILLIAIAGFFTRNSQKRKRWSRVFGKQKPSYNNH